MVISPWAPSFSPWYVAITPNGNFLYVTDGSTAVSVIDTFSQTLVTSITVGQVPLGIEITPDGNFAYVANRDSESVSVIRTSSNSVVATVPLGSGSIPIFIAIPPDGKLQPFGKGIYD